MVDRRVARTQALLQRAHLSLIVEKGYDAVTVEDICAAANVGRSTFYAHFSSKEDLHRRGLGALRQELSANQPAGVEPDHILAFSLPMFEHAHAHIELYRALASSRGGTIAIESIRDVLRDLVRAELTRLMPDRAAREFAVQYLVGGFLAVLTWWLDGGARSSPQEMDARFQRLAQEGLRGWT
ncbi:MAG TPA: TetR/AcrR family transcriptional regulator [Caulobacteraceae bacterium]|nr:TetR/AcrR family transcriptional regulator [Caulobacteraceae bacterium]